MALLYLTACPEAVVKDSSGTSASEACLPMPHLLAALNELLALLHASLVLLLPTSPLLLLQRLLLPLLLPQLPPQQREGLCLNLRSRQHQLQPPYDRLLLHNTQASRFLHQQS